MGIGQDPTRICPAMEKAGIRSAISQRGKDFCINKCPYDHCIVVETPPGRPTTQSARSQAKKELVQGMRANGWNPLDIALKTGISVHSVRRYLKP